MNVPLTIGAAAVSTCLFVSACGGGGDTRPVSVEPPSAAMRELIAAAPSASYEPIKRYSEALPNFGSITQSVNTNSDGITLDTTETAFDGNVFSLHVRRPNTEDIRLNTQEGSWSVSAHSSVIPNDQGRRARKWQLQQSVQDHLVADVMVTWDDENHGDYLAGGYWMVLHPAVVSDVSRIEIGAFVDGPEVALESRPFLPVTGTASYAGNASGMYAVEYAVEYISPAGGVELANWSGSAQLTVNFGSDTIGGCIGCGRGLDFAGIFIDGLTGDQSTFSGRYNWGLRLGPSVIDGNGTFRDYNVVVEHAGEALESDGAWGGRFSNINDPASAVPRLVAGTVGGHYNFPGRSRGGFAGSFFAAYDGP